MVSLASRFGSSRNTLRSSSPLSDEQIRNVAPSIFAEEKHVSRSQRYTCIPTIDVLRGLQKEGFSPFMVCQANSRDEGNRESAKHMIRLRHASQINAEEAQEVCLVNSHDGSSSYQMLAGVYRFVCANGMVCGDTVSDIRVRHTGNVVDNVIEGAFRVVDSFDEVSAQCQAMKALTLSEPEQMAFAHAALALRFDLDSAPAPITEAQLLQPKRHADVGPDLWKTFNRVQERMIKGGVRGRASNGKAMTTREVKGIDQNIKLNRALWVLSEEMRKLKG